MMQGFFAARSSETASVSFSAAGSSCIEATAMFFGSYSVSAAVTSFVMSTSTGPGRPLRAIRNARRNTPASSFTSFTIKLYLVIGMLMPAISIS